MEDSILAGARGRVFPLRRSRGYAPSAIEVPFEFRVPTLALGGHMKARLRLRRRRSRAVLVRAARAGDLDGLRAYSSYTDGIATFPSACSDSTPNASFTMRTRTPRP